jgi:uncharacterized protein
MVFLLLLVFLTQTAFADEKTFPSPQGYVNDFAGMLDSASLSEMDRSISDFQKKTTIEIAVVTIPTFEPYPSLEEYASELFKTWKIGQTKENNGILLIAAKKEKRIRIEVGYGLEEFIPDGLAGEIIRSQIRPYFKEGRYGSGMKQGVESVIRILAKKKGIPLDERVRKGKKSILDSPLFFDGVVFILFFLFILSRLFFSSFSGRNGPGGFWGSGGGGFGGGFGGFGGTGGGGFGGFGGGGSGGGGASDNW